MQIAAGSSATLPLVAGARLVLSGSGTAQVLPPIRVPVVQISDAGSTLGPFERDASVLVNAIRPVIARTILAGQELEADGDLIISDREARTLASAVSPFCIFCIPTLQAPGSGAARDVSGNGHDMVLGSGQVDATVWGDTSRELNSLAVQTDGVGTGNYLHIPTLNPVWNTSQWFIASMLFRPTVANQLRNIWNCSDDGAVGGWFFKLDAAGKVFLVLKDDAGNVGGNIASTPTLIAQNRTVHLTFAVCPVNRDIFLYANGVLANQWLASWTNVGVGTAGRRLTLASAGRVNNSSANSVYGGLYGAFQYYRGEGALPANHAAIARRLAHAPFLPLGYFDI